MSEMTAKHKQFLLASLVAIVLLSSSMLAPNFSAYADHDKGKSQDDKNGQKKSVKGEDPKETERCDNGASAKYKKH